ncbi:MAG TPA: hypothetical protein VGE44_10855 [Daejeonella sp.]|uniref:hypothetical protein n=1 Tax=Daejeonella sp. TaxID=2805397 RepID=UPI002EDA8CDE
MKTRTVNAQQNTNNAIANNLPEKKIVSEPDLELEKNHSVAMPIKSMQEMADNSAQVKQLKSIQAIADSRSDTVVHRISNSFINNSFPVFQFIRQGNEANNENPKGWYSDDGKQGPFPTRQQARDAENKANSTTAAASSSLQAAAWDGINNTTLDFGSQGSITLTMQEVLDGILEIAGDPYHLRTDGVVQLYAAKSGITAHVHVDIGVGGGMTKRGSREERDARTPPSLVEAIMRKPNYAEVKKQALELKEHYKAGGEKVVSPKDGIKFLETKAKENGTGMYVSSLADARSRNWNIGDIMVTGGAEYKWLKPHKAGDPINSGDISLTRLKGG